LKINRMLCYRRPTKIQQNKETKVLRVTPALTVH
jgi:hypothetical protein